MGEVIAITSGKGGVGKTTITANLGGAAAMHGKSVVLVDADTESRDLDLIMGLEGRAVYDINDYVNKKCRLNQVLLKDERFGELYIIPSSKSWDAVSCEKMKALCFELKKKFDLVILDCPTCSQQGFRGAVACADRVIVVVLPEVASVKSADRAMGIICGEGMDKPELAVNRVRSKLVKKRAQLSSEDLCRLLNTELLCEIPEDDCIIAAGNTGEPAVLNPRSRAGDEYERIAYLLTADETQTNEKGASKTRGLNECENYERSRA